jgi:endoglucanase
VSQPDAELRVMLAGHVDEIGLMVNTIDEQGFVGFVPIGGVDPAVLAAQRVRVLGADGPVPGVIGRKAIHLMEQEERGKASKMHELWLDIGAKDKEDAEKAVAVGDPIVIDAGFQQFRNELAVARAFDDRVGAFVCLEAMRLLAERELEAGVYCVTTVQEEVGLRGATTSAYGCDPHVGLAVDVGFATDHPQGGAERFGEAKLGGGPILHRGCNINPVVGRGLIDAAKGAEIPYQMSAAPRRTGTDAAAIQLSRGGVATGLISVPNRYMHTPVEMVSLEDLENCAQLLAEYCASLQPGMDFIPA